MAFFLKGLGDPVQRINEILPRFDASIFNFLTQLGAGVCWWETTRFNATIVDRGVNIGAGMAHAHGYFGMSDSTHRINVTLPASGTQFCRIFAEINLSTIPHRFRIAATNQSTSNSIGLVQNNLTINHSGIHQIPLYLVTIPANGQISVTDQRVQLHRLQNAQHAQTADAATDANNLTGTVANAATATTQTRSNNTTRIATTAFVHSVANHVARRITAGGTSGGRMQFDNGLFIQWRESSSQNITFNWAFPNQCIFVGFVGFWADGGTNACPWISDIGVYRPSISRTGFRWVRQSGTARVNQRRYLAIGF